MFRSPKTAAWWHGLCLRWQIGRRTEVPTDTPSRRPRPVLCRADQWTLAVLVAGCFSTILVNWAWQSAFRGGRIEIEKAERLAADFEVQLNEAQWPELTLLPGIGETLARRIVEYRDKHGPFQSVDQLEHVKGIGPKTMRRIRTYLRVEAPPIRGGIHQNSAPS